MPLYNMIFYSFYPLGLYLFKNIQYSLLKNINNEWHAFSASEFNPDFTIVSAGFDAARGDPLGCCDVRILLTQSLSFAVLFCFMLWTDLLHWNH